MDNSREFPYQRVGNRAFKDNHGLRTRHAVHVDAPGGGGESECVCADVDLVPLDEVHQVVPQVQSQLAWDKFASVSSERVAIQWRPYGGGHCSVRFDSPLGNGRLASGDSAALPRSSRIHGLEKVGVEVVVHLAYIVFKLFYFLHSPTIHSLKTVLYLLSFEAFNDSMYSTNMVSFDCSPWIRQPRCYIHCL